MMTPNLRLEIIRIAKTKLGEGATVEQVVEFLYAGGAINNRSLRFHVIGAEFFRLMRDTDRTASDIEQELAARYDVSQDFVKYIRGNFARGGSFLKCGKPPLKKG